MLLHVSASRAILRTLYTAARARLPVTAHRILSSRLHTSALTAARMSAPSSAAPADSKKDLWNPEQYLLFDEARARPGVDLLQRAVATLNHMRLPQPARVADLGCGPGKQVALLAKQFPQANIVGIDSSENMVAAARAATDKLGDAQLSARVNFKQATFETFEDSTGLDLLYSNAALHWSKTHDTLFPHLMQQVKEGTGVLAVQMPNNFREPSHTLMRTALLEGKFCATDAEVEAIMAKSPQVNEAGSSYYFHLLFPHARHTDVWETQYQQLISSTTQYHPVLEWTKSTALAPLLASLKDEAERTKFQQIYSGMLEKVSSGIRRAGLMLAQLFDC
jgi:trans-aconitate 2-methyltransferase